MLTDAALHRLELLADRVRDAESVVVLTGAGVSTESGLPDYRGVDGLWRNRRLEQLADLGTFRREPALVWDFYRERLAGLTNATPNPGHFALAALQRAGLVKALLTQNVDGLHRRAGSHALELHGRLDEAHCLICGVHEPATDVLRPERLDLEKVPLCLVCGTAMKPGVVMFGEQLDAAIVGRAFRIVDSCDLLVCVGTSLEVVPVATFARLASERAANALVIVNDGETADDRRAALRVQARSGEALPALARLLDVS